MSNIRVRNLPGLRGATAAVVTPEDLAVINALYAPKAMAADELHTRRAKVAHNQHDRTYERFPKAYLERFAETLPGKSLLPGHNTSELPMGRWYQADTRTRTEEFAVIPGAPKSADIVPGMEAQKTRVTWLEASFYFVADPGTELMRKNIDSGVYQDVSIGFSFDDIHCDVCKRSYWKSDCPHLAGRPIEDGKGIVTLTYAGDPKLCEARETSIVYLGAQQQAELMKSLREGTLDPQKLALTQWGTDPVALKLYEAIARERTGAKQWQGAEFSSSVGEAAASDEADITPPTDAAIADKGQGDEMEAIRKALGLADTADEAQAVAAIQTLATAKATAEAREPLAKIGETALKDLRDAVLADEIKLKGEESAHLSEMTEYHLKSGNYDRLKALRDESHAAVLVKFPAGISGDTSATSDVKTPAVDTPAEIRRLALAG